ncbi:MAG: TolB family protein, partial [Planctomycetota bacterium]
MTAGSPRPHTIVLLTILLLSGLCAEGKQDESVPGQRSFRDRCPPIVFVKRRHFGKPFGIGTIIGWDIYSPGCGIYTYDPKRPEEGAKEIFRRDDGTIYDMSASYDAKTLLFAFLTCGKKAGGGSSLLAAPLAASHVFERDTLGRVLSASPPAGSGEKPNHSFWPRKGGEEWMSVDLGERRKVSSVQVYWFDDQPRGGCTIPESWRLEYKKDGKWHAVRGATPYAVRKDAYNTLRFAEVATSGLRIVMKCRAGKSGGVQRWRIGGEKEHAEFLAGKTSKPHAADSDERSFHIYEINVDGSGLRKITAGRFHDIHPFYLPTGDIGFVSTRVNAHTLCQPGAACAIHVMDADGSNIRRIHFATLADHSPFVMDDGSILFTRWEYQDKSLTYPQGLWTVNPDGTRVQLFYGNTIYDPAVTWQAKPIPGRTEVVCTLAPHHGNPVGAVGIIDRTKGLENPGAIRNITPEIPYRAGRDRMGPGDRQFPWAYRDPYPIAEDLFLVSYGGPMRGGPKRYRLYLLDEKGNKEPL